MDRDRPEAPRPRLELTPRRAGDVITAGLEVFGRAWRELLLISALVTIPLTFAETLFADWVITEASIARETDGATLWTALAATIAAIVVGFAVTLLVQAAATRAVADVIVGRAPSVSTSYRAALSRLGAILGSTFLIVLGVTGGFVLLIVPGIVFAVRWLVTMQAIVIERLGGVEAMRRSWHLVRGEGWHAFAVFLVVELLVALAAQLVSRLFPVDLLWQGIAVALSQTVLVPLASAVYVVLYVNLRVAKHGLNADILRDELDR